MQINIVFWSFQILIPPKYCVTQNCGDILDMRSTRQLAFVFVFKKNHATLWIWSWTVYDISEIHSLGMSRQGRPSTRPGATRPPIKRDHLGPSPALGFPRPPSNSVRGCRPRSTSACLSFLPNYASHSCCVRSPSYQCGGCSHRNGPGHCAIIYLFFLVCDSNCNTYITKPPQKPCYEFIKPLGLAFSIRR